MITGLHALIYALDANAARTFFREILGLKCIDAGEGWLIFAMPPAELGVHPSEQDTSPGESGSSGSHTLSLMCDDIEKTVAELKGKGVAFTRAVSDQGWGLVTRFKVPGAGEMQLYQPKHKTAIAQARA